MNQSERDYLRALRICEVERTLPLFRYGQRVLEIGAGHGYQAKYLADNGMRVVALDIAGSPYITWSEWPLVLYDGEHIPLPDHSVDVVFSANVLLQIPHVMAFQRELKRVLKSDGYAIHLLPNANWRIWTLLTFYPSRLKQVTWRIIDRIRSPQPSEPVVDELKPTSQTQWRRLTSLIMPSRISAFGNPFAEIYYLSSAFWCRLFRSGGWRIERVSSTGLFYSGNILFGSSLSIRTRQRLRHVFGSVCLIYVVYPEN